MFAFGDAAFVGSSGNPSLFGAIAGILAAPDGGGYALVTVTGVVLSFATGARFFPDQLAIPHLRSPIVGVAKAPVGYWAVAGDGGVFAFGGAPFFGSMAHRALNGPVVGMAATRDGRGYFLTGADGGVFTFGDAAFAGSTGSVTVADSFVGIAAS